MSEFAGARNVHGPRDMSVSRVRTVARRLRLGAALLALRHFADLGVRHALLSCWARRTYLRRVEAIAPVACSREGADVRMLLNHRRLYEGTWALLSLLQYLPWPCRISIHDDGTLSGADLAFLADRLPGIQVISRATADGAIVPYLRERGFERCLRMRQTLPFALKFFDPILMSSGTFLLLDSDVLFFRRPDDLLGAMEQGRPRFSVDGGDYYVVPSSDMARLLGRPCIGRLNPGVLVARVDPEVLGTVEEWLKHPGFWDSGNRGTYYAELTLWAMAQTLAGAEPLPDGYALCTADPTSPTAISGHYCGGGREATQFYTRGLPYVYRSLSEPIRGSAQA